MALIMAVASIWLLGDNGILLFVFSAPIATVMAGWWFVRKLQRPAEKVSRTQIATEWKTLGRLGLAFMFGGLVVNACQLFIRTEIQRDLGTGAVGQFQAAWTLSMQYGSLILAGLSVDYYPRLTATIERKQDTNLLVNDQVELTLLLGAPIYLLLIGTGPWLIPLLFSAEFPQAASILRWQVLGDVLRLSIWPVAFLLMALGRAERLMMAEGAGYVVAAAATTLLIPALGVAAAGLASLIGYSLFFVLLLWAGRSLTQFRLDRRNALSLAVLFTTCASIAGLGFYSTAAALGVALVSSAIVTAYGYGRLLDLLDLPAKSGLVILLRSVFRR